MRTKSLECTFSQIESMVDLCKGYRQQVIYNDLCNNTLNLQAIDKTDFDLI